MSGNGVTFSSSGGGGGAVTVTNFPASQKVNISQDNLDPFSRLRTSNTIQLLDSKFDHSDQSLIWNQELTGGGASVTHNVNHAALELGVSGIGDKVISQTKMYIPYRAGNGDLGLYTFVLGAATPGVRKRVGRFDDNDGVYFEQSEAGEYFIVLRSSVTGSVAEERIPRNLWEYIGPDGSLVHDGFDGLGPSGITGDPTTGVILVIDLQWLGMGLVRVGFDYDGVIFWAHFFRNAGNKSTVYMRSATLPIRYEIEAVGDAADTFEQACSTVLREGSAKEPARRSSVNRGNTTVDITAGGGRQAVVAVRLKSDFNKSLIEDFTPNIIATESAEYLWELVLNPTVDPADAAVWNAGWVDAESPESIVQRNFVYRSGNDGCRFLPNTGFVLKSGYFERTNLGGGATVDIPGEDLPVAQLNVAGDSDVLVLLCTVVGAVDRQVLGSIGFKELV